MIDLGHRRLVDSNGIVTLVYRPFSAPGSKGIFTPRAAAIEAANFAGIVLHGEYRCQALLATGKGATLWSPWTVMQFGQTNPAGYEAGRLDDCQIEWQEEEDDDCPL